MNDTVFEQAIEAQAIPQLLEDSSTVANLAEFLAEYRQGLDEDSIAKLKAMAFDEEASEDQQGTHPSIRVRLGYAEKYDSGTPVKSEPVESLFEDWSALNADLAELFNLRLKTYLEAFQQLAYAEESENEILGIPKQQISNTDQG